MTQFDTFQVRIISEMYCLWQKQGIRVYVVYAGSFSSECVCVCVCVCLNMLIYQENISAERCRRNGETGDSSGLWAESGILALYPLQYSLNCFLEVYYGLFKNSDILKIIWKDTVENLAFCFLSNLFPHFHTLRKIFSLVSCVLPEFLCANVSKFKYIF